MAGRVYYGERIEYPASPAPVMLRLHYSNRTEELLAALTRNVEAERARRGALAPIALVVPNRNVETYVKLGLAQGAGIAANLEVTFLRRLLAQLGERALPGARIVDAEQLEGHLLDVLHDEDRLAAPDLAPVRAYLAGGGDVPDAVDRRRCQLAATLARLFDEYGSSRPRLLADWRRGPTLAAHPVFGPLEAWQRALWLELFGPEGRVARRSAREGVTWLPLFELLATTQDGLDATGLPPALHVFGVSYVAESYHRMLDALGRKVDVFLYTLNPCREFWEDLETRGEARRRQKREARARLFPARRDARQPALALSPEDPFGLADDDEPLPLRLWGRPGRENIRILNQLTDADFEARFVAHEAPTTLLARLQNDILDRVSPAAPDPAAAPDGSLRVLACPGLRRELEVVAAEIWRLVRADPTLRFNDIAVVVPEARKDAYLSHVGAVFGESHDLPHSLVDLPLAGGHRLGEAIERLIELPLGGFTRREVLPLFTHPAVMARFPEATAADWLALAEELTVVHGADHQDHAGTYIERDLFNWDQGLRRIALGALMTGPRSGDEAPALFDDRPYLPAERTGDEQPPALAFALLVRSLIEDARFASGVTGPRCRPLGAWGEFLRGLLTSYLVPADDAEAALLARCLRELQGLEDTGLGDRPVSYRVAAELARARLGGLGGQRGQYLAHGVTVASFVPMRAIPFRAVFVLGLGHGDFPAGARRSPLDLREAGRQRGDVSPREQDLYMFLETLLCARERLTLSYVARDELTGETLQPSSAVLELKEVLRRYLPPPALTALFDEGRRIPLRRHEDDPARVEAHSLAARERRALELGRALRAALPPGTAAPELPALRRLLPPATLDALAPALALHPPPRRQATAARREAPRVVVSLAALRQFLEDPLQGSARFRLRMRELEGDEELVDRDEEPFETPRPARTRLLREVMLGALTAEGEGRPDAARLRALYARAALRDELLGHLPTGALRALEAPEDQAVLEAWWTHAVRLGGGAPPAGRLFRFGRAAEHEAADAILPPLVLDLPGIVDPQDAGNGPEPLRVELVGRTELVVPTAPDEQGSLMFAVRTGDKGKADRERLRAFLDHVVLSAAALAPGGHRSLSVYATGQPGDDGCDDRPFAALDPARARGYLTSLIADLLTGVPDPETGAPTGVHAYVLPCEAVWKAMSKGARAFDGDRLVEIVEDLREEHALRGKGFSTVYGPVPHAAERHHPPPPAEAARMAERRFGLYFELLGEPT